MTFLAYLKTRFLHIAALILGSAALTFFVCRSCLASPARFATVTLYGSAMWIFMWLGNEYISVWLDEKIPWTKEPNRRFMVGATAVIIYSVVIAYLIASLFEYGFDLRVGGFSQVYWTVILAVGIILFMTSRSFLLNWKQTAINAERLQRESINARYENLKNQVNPHFLFNSLNALSNLVYEDQARAVQFIQQLSEVYRYVLDTRDQEIVHVREELKFLKSYVFLQQIRFGEKLVIDIDIGNADVFIAPLALQMLIENAIKHNVIGDGNPLLIRVHEGDGYIHVANNLQPKVNRLEPSAGMGLENIIRRYTILADKKVEIVRTKTSFTVKLPLLKPGKS